MTNHCETSSSAIIIKAVSGSHVLKIDGYSQAKELAENGEYMVSIPFSVGGHRWVITLYPNGSHEECADYISVYLMCDTVVAKDVNANLIIDLLDKDGTPVLLYRFSSSLTTFSSKQPSGGVDKFIRKETLERSVYLKDDCFTIRCIVTIPKEIRNEETKSKQFVVVPPSDLHQHFGELLKSMNGTDVAFEVGGGTFAAHRCVLAARSSVFSAELFGSMKERIHSHMPIKIDDMEQDVFKALLHFIYTDTLPEMSQVGSNEAHTSVAMAQHLLVAADRYNIERLKLLCEDKLCKHMDSNMVATTLALAEQHSCRGLKEACFDFLASPSNFKAMTENDGYEHLLSSCPSVVKELINVCLLD